jgi:UDP-N-acetylmuramate dehydrogenase
MDIRKNRSLKALNTFKVAAKSAYFMTLENTEDLQTLLTNDQWSSTQKLILGSGSNILFTQDYPGLVIKNALTGIQTVDENNDHIWIKVAAGENWHALVLYCVQRNYGGIENLSLIPGTVGATPVQNIGAYGVEVCTVIESLEAIEFASGNLVSFQLAQCQFNYRHSVFKGSLKNKFFITSVTFKLNKRPVLNMSYGAIQSTLEKTGLTPSVQSISHAVIAIRQHKLPNPSELPNAGSFFKNPYISLDALKTLQNKNPDIPYYIESKDRVKIPAGWLIEQCGWKGKKIGMVGVHQQQALVLINYGNASGNDIMQLAESIQQSIEAQFGIRLLPEVSII